jgi:hypothetical protein
MDTGIQVSINEKTRCPVSAPAGRVRAGTGFSMYVNIFSSA